MRRRANESLISLKFRLLSFPFIRPGYRQWLSTGFPRLIGADHSSPVKTSDSQTARCRGAESPLSYGPGRPRPNDHGVAFREGHCFGHRSRSHLSAGPMACQFFHRPPLSRATVPRFEAKGAPLFGRKLGLRRVPRRVRRQWLGLFPLLRVLPVCDPGRAFFRSNPRRPRFESL